MTRYIELRCFGSTSGELATQRMTSIVVRFEEGETDFHNAKAKALGRIVEELCRYGLHEALNGIGILDEYGKRQQKEVEAVIAQLAKNAAPK